MLHPDIRTKLAKVYELVKRGATEGERAAAQKALDRLIEKYDLRDEQLDRLDRIECSFKYSTDLDLRLFLLLLKRMAPLAGKPKLDTWHVREIAIHLTYLENIAVAASYAYFKKHMRTQWVKNCAHLVKRKRKAKTKNERRKQLQQIFFTAYAIESNLIEESELTTKDIKEMSAQEIADRLAVFNNVEGGKYHTQVQSGHLLTN